MVDEEKVILTTGPEMVWMMIGMHECFRVREVFGISAFWDAIWCVLKISCSVCSVRTGATDGVWTMAYPNRHNAFHLLKSQNSSPWFLHVHAEGITNVFPQFPVINSVWVKLYRLR